MYCGAGSLYKRFLRSQHCTAGDAPAQNGSADMAGQVPAEHAVSAAALVTEPPAINRRSKRKKRKLLVETAAP